MVTKGGPHSGPPEGHPVVTKGVDPTIKVHETNQNSFWSHFLGQTVERGVEEGRERKKRRKKKKKKKEKKDKVKNKVWNPLFWFLV